MTLAAAPEYLVVYEIAPPGLEVRNLLADTHDISSFVVNAPAPPPAVGSAVGGAAGGGKRKKAAASAAEDGESGSTTAAAAHGPGAPPLLPLPVVNDHLLLEVLLGGELLSMPSAHPTQQPTQQPHHPHHLVHANRGKDDEDGSGMLANPAADAAAVAKAAAEEEKAAVAAAVGRAQRQSARRASEQAVLLQLERRIDEAFRAHDYRIWHAAHPATGTMLERSAERVRQLQSQLGQAYEAIRHEHAHQFQLKAQIEARSGNTPAAAQARAESMLEQALKSARQSVIATAAAHDEGGGAYAEAPSDGAERGGVA